MILQYGDSIFQEVYSDYALQHNRYIDFVESRQDIPSVSVFRGMKNLPNYRVLLFHFEILPSDLLETVGFLKTFHNIQIIVFATKSVGTTQMFSELSHLGVRDCLDFPTNTTNETYTSTLQKIFTDDGVSFAETIRHNATFAVETLQAQITVKLTIPDDFMLTVGVIGTQARVGTTTQAFMLYHVLKSIGFMPCIIDPTQDFSMTLLRLYEQDNDVSDSVLHINGVHIASSKQVNTEHNAYITDYGVLTEKNVAAYCENDLRYLCSGSKAWELPQLAAAMTSYPSIATSQVLFSFAAEEEQGSLQELASEFENSVFVPYNPSLWKCKEEDAYYHDTIPLLKELLP